MRFLFLFFLLGLGAFAQSTLTERGGQYLSVRVEGAPSTVTSAVMDLNSDLPGLPLRADGEGIWSGSFVMLPNMVEGLTRPKIHLFDAAGREQTTGRESGVTVDMASSDFDQEGLATVLGDRKACFVFDAKVDAATIQIVTHEGLASPLFLGQTFTMPRGVAPHNVFAVVAQTAAGADMVYLPDWRADIADSQDEL